MPDYIDSYYTRTSKLPIEYRHLDSSMDVEVCIIGGGLAGLEIALNLAERGRSVAVVEQRRVGWGASGRNAGLLSPGFTLSPQKLVKLLGAEHARELYDLSFQGHIRLLSQINQYSIDCGPVQRGELRCARSDEKETLEQYRDFMEEVFNVRVDYWPRSLVSQSLATTHYGDAIFNPHTYSIHTLNLVNGLACAIRNNAGHIFENTPAVRIGKRNNRKQVHTPFGIVTAEHVVLTCGGYVSKINNAVWYATVPISTFLMVTEPLGDKLTRTFATPYAVSDIDDPPNYYRPLSDGRLMWGGRDLIWEPSPIKIAEMLKMDMVAVYPDLRDVHIEVAWGGRMSYLRHSMPVIGKIGDGLWCATGFGGLGLAGSTMAGTMVGGGIVDSDDRWRLFTQFGLPFAGGPLGRIPAQLIYWGQSLRKRLRRKWASKNK